MDLENKDLTGEETTEQVEITYFTVTPIFKGTNGKYYGFYCVTRPEDVQGLYTYFANMLGVLGVDSHLLNLSIHVTEDEKITWREAAEATASLQSEISTLLSTVSNLESKVGNIMDGLYTDITTNPWSVNFKDVDGITMTDGIWNQTKERVEW